MLLMTLSHSSNRAPEDGYYMFTLVVREDGDAHCAGSLMMTLASDPNNASMLCRAEQGCARFPEFTQNFSERQILWSLCSVDFHTLTLQFPIQTQHFVVPELQVFVSSLENCQNFNKTSTPQSREGFQTGSCTVNILQSLVNKLKKPLVQWKGFVDNVHCTSYGDCPKTYHVNQSLLSFLSLQVITQLLAGDQVYVVAEGFEADVENSFYMADGFTSFTGLQVRSGLEWIVQNLCNMKWNNKVIISNLYRIYPNTVYENNSLNLERQLLKDAFIVQNRPWHIQKIYEIF